MLRISPINTANYKRNNVNKSSDNKTNQITQPSFKAKEYPSGIYSNWFVNEMHGYMQKPEDERKKIIDKKLETYREISQSKHLSGNFFGKVDADVKLRSLDYANLENDMSKEQKEEVAYKKQIKKIEAAEKAAYEREKLSIKNRQLAPIFCDKVRFEKEGKEVTFPNSIMLVGDNKKLNQYLIRWTASNSDCTFKTLPKNENVENLMSSFYKTLNEIKESNERTLLYVDGFEDLINPEVNSKHGVDCIKKVMSKLADGCKTTLIFETSNAYKLEPSALEPHRVTNVINTNIEIDPIDIEISKPEFEHKDCYPEIDKPDREYSSLKDYKRRYKETPDPKDLNEDGTYLNFRSPWD